MERFTLHVRLTRRCNADCAYCSSWLDGAMTFMPVAEFHRAVDFICGEVLPLIAGRPAADGRIGDFITLQYLGGEILTVPKPVLRDCVLYARQAFAQRFGTVIDGVQSNLIGSAARVGQLHTLFGNRIGTSVDHFGTQRTVAGSADKYREVLAARRDDLRRRRGYLPDAIFVVDHEGVINAPREVDLAEAGGYNITLRPVFQGGSHIAPAALEQMLSMFAAEFDRWALSGTVIVEPFYRLMMARLATVQNDAAGQLSFAACPFQKNCAEVSLDLEPDGGLYVCQDMADSGQYRLGDAVAGSFDVGVWSLLARRREHYDSRCRQCTWLAECQGGCMSEAIHQYGDPYARTDLCPIWKMLFARIDALIARHGAAAVRAWAEGLGRGRRAAA